MKKNTVYKNEKEILIDAIRPAGNLELLNSTFYNILLNYLKNPYKECLSGEFKGTPMDVKLLGEGSNPQGMAYRLKISLEEVIW